MKWKDEIVLNPKNGVCPPHGRHDIEILTTNQTLNGSHEGSSLTYILRCLDVLI